MAKDFIIIEGKNLNELIEEGLSRLDKEEDDVEVEILEQGKTIVGISIKKYKIKMIIKENKDNEKYINKKLELLEKEFSNIDINENLKSFELSYKKDGVYLLINDLKLKPDLNLIIEKVKDKQIKEVDYALIKSIIDLSESNPIKIAPAQDEIPLDSKAIIEISKDKMSGYLTIKAPDGGKILSFNEIKNQIEELIKIDIYEETIKNIIVNEEYDTKTAIAKGILPIDGKDGYIEYIFENNKKNSPYILEDGSVDFRNLDLISNVKKGDVVAQLKSPIPGEDGVNVLGEVLPHKLGRVKSFKYGANVVISEDGNKLISNLDGQVCNENGKITVYELYIINKDVDTSTGNIDFNGNVKIQGSVLTGFEVKAKGNIEIEGVVEGAIIKCDGDLIIKRGIQGYNMANIDSGGNIFTKYIENAKVSCKGNIEAEAIMHSETLCEGSVKIDGKKGLLVGGSCKATKEINAKVIGSHMATATFLELGIDSNTRENQEKLKALKENTETDIDKLDKMINYLTRLKNENNLEEDKLELLSKSITAKLQLKRKLLNINQELEDMDEKIKDSSNGKVNVKETIYSNVKIVIGNSQMTIKEKKDHCTIYRDMDDYEIKIGPYIK